MCIGNVCDVCGVVGSFEFFDFFAEVFFEFGEVAGACFKGASYLFDFVYGFVEFLYLFDPFVDMQLVPVNITLNYCNIIDYFLGLIRHHFDFLNQVSLMPHVQLLQVEDELLFIAQ